MIVFSVVFDIIELFPSFWPDTALELLLCSVISVLVIVIFWLDFPVSPPWTTVFVVILEDVSNGIWAIPLDDFDSFVITIFSSFIPPPEEISRFEDSLTTP